MHDLIKLFSLFQLTKDQPLTGYLSAGIKLNETATLAEHHYTAMLMAYFLVKKIKQKGGKISERKVILMLMVHDLSELFGGDVAAPLNRKYPDLRVYKDKIGERAIELLTEYMDMDTKEEFKKLWHELIEGKTDETIVAKILDQMDHQFFLEYHNFKQKYNPGHEDYRPRFFQNHIIKLTDRIVDPIVKKVMDDFLLTFKEHYFNKGFQGLSLLMEDE